MWGAQKNARESDYPAGLLSECRYKRKCFSLRDTKGRRQPFILSSSTSARANSDDVCCGTTVDVWLSVVHVVTPCGYVNVSPSLPFLLGTDD